jgi:hypothetical protein
MTLDVAYSYCINLTEEEKISIDKQVAKNRMEIKFVVFLGLPFLPNLPLLTEPSVFPDQAVFAPQQIVREAKDRFEEAINDRMSRLAEVRDEYQEAYNNYKVYNNMSPTLSKVSKKVRKDKETSKSLDKLEKQLEDVEFHGGRGSRKLPGTETIYYMRAGNKARLFYRYSEKERGAVEKLAESNKKKEQEVIDNLKQNYK